MGGAVAVVAAAVTKAVASFSITNFLIGTAISMALNAATTALFGKKSSGSSGVDNIKRSRQEVVRSSVAARRLVYGTSKVGGALVFAETTGANDKFMHLVVVLAAHEVEEIGAVYLDDEVLPTPDSDGFVRSGTFKNRVRIKKHLGSDDQVADPDLVSEAPSWTSAHRLRGLAYIYVRLEYNSDVFPAGLPKPTAIVKGKKLYDPRTGMTAWSNNWALALRDYILSADGVNGDADDVDDDSFIAAANISDEQVDSASGFQDRYTMDGVVYTDDKPIDVLEDILTAGAGALVYTKGQYHLYAGAYREPEIELSEKDVIDEFKVTPRVPRDQLFNRVKGTFIDPDEYWLAADFPPVENSLYVTQDGGEEITRDIEMPYTANSARAQRIARIHLEKSRQGITVEAIFNLRALRVAVMDSVMLSIDRLGWDQKVFTVLAWTFEAGGGVRMTLQEESPAVYDWNSGYETTRDPAPDTNLPSPGVVSKPTGLSASSGGDELYVSSDGTVQSRIRVSWTPSESDYVIAYLLGYRKDGDAEFTEVTLPGTSSEHYISPVKDGDIYTLRLRAVNIRQAKSESVTISHTVVGKTSPPPDVEQFFVDRMADGTRRFQWSMGSVPADVRVGGGYVLRYQTGASFDWGGATALHGGILSSSPYETNDLAAGQYTFGVKAVDSSGNESENALTATVTLGDPRLRSVVLARFEHAFGWPGTKTDCFVNTSGLLEAKGVGTWDDLPADFDSLAGSWLDVVAAVSPIAYETEVFDLGADLSFSPLLTVACNGAYTVEMRTGADADGSIVTAYGAATPVTLTRYVQFKVTSTTTSPLIEGLTILLDGEVVIDDFENVNTASATDIWFERIATGHFKVKTTSGLAVITQAQITALQNVGSGYSWELVNKTTTLSGGDGPAAEFKVYDQSGTLRDAVVDILLRGPKSA